nr:EamA family transporter [Brevibacillus aydinogluensis]
MGWQMKFSIVHGGIGFYFFFAGMKGLHGQSIAVLSYIAPLTSLVISALVIGEQMTVQQLVGAVLLLGAIWIGESGRAKGIETPIKLRRAIRIWLLMCSLFFIY